MTDDIDPAADWSDFETFADRRNRIGAANMLLRIMDYTDPAFVLSQVAQYVCRRIVEAGAFSPGAMARYRFIRSRGMRGTYDDAYELISLYLTGDPDSLRAADRLCRRVVKQPAGWWFSAVITDLLDSLPPTGADVIEPLRGRVTLPGDAGR